MNKDKSLKLPSKLTVSQYELGTQFCTDVQLAADI